MVTLSAHGQWNDQLCVKRHRLQLHQYDDIQLRYCTFIPCEAIPGPGYCESGELLSLSGLGFYPVFGGDNRTFDPLASSYRSVHQVTVNVSDHFDTPTPPSIELANQLLPFGMTTAYEVVPNGTAEIVCSCACACPVSILGPPAASTRAQSHPGNTGILMTRLDHNSIKVRMLLFASNPVTPIDCQVIGVVDVDLLHHIDPVSAAQEVTVTTFIQRTPFPAHEMYIGLPNASALHQYDPIPNGVGVQSLCAGASSLPVESFKFATPSWEPIP